MCGYEYMSVGTLVDQSDRSPRAGVTDDCELYNVGIEFKSSGRAVSALNH